MVGAVLQDLFITQPISLLSSFLSPALCFWQCYQRHNSKQRCTCSLGRSGTAASSKSGSATKKAPERANADKSHKFSVWCERELRGRLFITLRGSVQSTFSTSHLNTGGGGGGDDDNVCFHIICFTGGEDEELMMKERSHISALLDWWTVFIGGVNIKIEM